jgi:hypothetical protein
LHEELEPSLRNKYAVTDIFQPIAMLGIVVEDLKVQSKHLTNEGDLTVVEEPGSSLVKICSYRNEEDLQQHFPKQHLHRCWVYWLFSLSQ